MHFQQFMNVQYDHSTYRTQVMLDLYQLVTNASTSTNELAYGLLLSM